MSTVFTEDQAPPGLDPREVTDIDGLAALAALGFARLGVEICLPEQDGQPTLFTGDDREFMDSMAERGTRAVVLRSPDGRTTVSPEFGFGVPLATFHTLLASGDVVVTRLRPDTLPDMEVTDGAVAPDGTPLAPVSPRVMAVTLAVVGITDGRVFPDLPGRGLHRVGREADHAAVWALHQEHVARVSDRTGSQPVELDMARHLAVLRREQHVNDLHTAEQELYQARLSEALALAITALLALGALQWGLEPAWVGACVVAVPLGLWSQQFARHWILWWFGLLVPIWLPTAARVLGEPRSVYQPVAALAVLVLTAWFAREAWGLLLVHRVFPAVSARAQRPPRVAAEDLVDAYSE